MRTLGLVLLLVLAAVVLGGLIHQRNQLLEERRHIDVEWARVDAGMKSRADLVPGLLELSKAHTGPTGREELAKAHAALLAANGKQQEIAANARLASAIRRLLDDPALKANPEEFQRLSDAFATAENRIAVDRRDYNDAIKKYNLDLQLFPNNLAAAVLGFHRDDNYFVTTE